MTVFPAMKEFTESI